MISSTTDAETDRTKVIRDCDHKCHKMDEPLSFNTAEEDGQEGDETPKLIETDDKDDEEPERNPKQVHTATITEKGPNNKPSWME